MQAKYNKKLQDVEAKLKAANDTISRLKTSHGYHVYSDSLNGPIPEDEQLPSGSTTMIESSSSMIIHSNTEDDMSSSPSKRKPGHQMI